MSFIPHTKEDIATMLAEIGISDIEALYDEIPDEFKIGTLEGIPSAANEMEVVREITALAAKDKFGLNFIGAGAYEHFIPSVVWELTTRGEFYTAYTPYQAEASQGTLQLIYEYQSMMSNLMAHDISNASLYDGASALAEAILMAIRVNRTKDSKKNIMPRNLHPSYKAVAESITTKQGVELIDIEFNPADGLINTQDLDSHSDATALVIQNPNFFGSLENVDGLTDWAHSQNIIVIAVVNPIAMALLKPPGIWGERGADIACGEGQPLGVPLSSGGPYYGFMTTRGEFSRQLPGRIVGKTLDSNGNEGFVLTLQAREQHIRRSKATSNICTNQGLMVTASTMYMSLYGEQGLVDVAKSCHSKLNEFITAIKNLKGIEVLFDSERFHEVAICMPKSSKKIIEYMESHGISPGLDLSLYFPKLENTVLTCITEVKTTEDIQAYVSLLEEALEVIE